MSYLNDKECSIFSPAEIAEIERACKDGLPVIGPIETLEVICGDRHES